MNKKLIFSMMFGASIVLSANIMQAQNAESYESLMKKGNDKFSAKDYISAKTYYEMALKQKSGDATAKKKLDETVKKIQEDGARQVGPAGNQGGSAALRGAGIHRSLNGLR